MSTNGVVHHEEQKPRVVWGENADCSESVLVKVKDIPTLRTHWKWIEERLIALKKKDRHTEKWLPAHVRDAIIRGFTGQSTVELYFSIAKDNSIDGFMITTVYADPYLQIPESLVVWILWANQALIDHHLPALEQMARDRFLGKVHFFSGRRGWLSPKKAAKRGFKVTAMVYTLEVN